VERYRASLEKIHSIALHNTMPIDDVDEFAATQIFTFSNSKKK